MIQKMNKNKEENEKNDKDIIPSVENPKNEIFSEESQTTVRYNASERLDWQSLNLPIQPDEAL